MPCKILSDYHAFVFTQTTYFYSLFRLEATTNDSEPLYGSIDLRLTHLCTTLLKKLVPVNRGNSVMPNNLKIALSNTLLNPILLRLYPALHSSVLDYVEVKQYSYQMKDIYTFILDFLWCQYFSNTSKLQKS